MAPSVGIVVPAYDPDIPRLIEYVHDLEVTIDPAELRVELDDPTSRFTRRDLAAIPATVHRVAERRGKGRAITDGFNALDSDVLAFTDADGSVPARSFCDVIRRIGVAPVCVGSRRHPDATIQSHQTVVRRTLGNGFAWLARTTLPVRLYDYQCGAKAVTREVWEEVRDHLTESGFAWDVELIGLAAGHGHAIEEVPVTWCDQPGSTVHPVSTSLELIRALFRVNFKLRHGTTGARTQDGTGTAQQHATVPPLLPSAEGPTDGSTSTVEKP